jgi:hypothetical protein
VVIYHTAPVRCFPLLVEAMAPRFANAYHFRMPIVARNLTDHRFGMLQNVLAYDHDLVEVPRASRPDNGFPHNVLDNGIDFVEPSSLEPIDLLYGVFDGRLIRKVDDDFVFTVISHPVQHVYDVFRYLAFVNESSQGPERYSEGVALFDDIVAAGMEQFVDRFLAGDQEVVVGGRAFDLVDDFCRFNLDVPYDFVGVEARIEGAVAVLSERLGITITPSEALLSRASSLASDEVYRRDDLCRSLAREVAAYEALESLSR